MTDHDDRFPPLRPQEDYEAMDDPPKPGLIVWLLVCAGVSLATLIAAVLL